MEYSELILRAIQNSGNSTYLVSKETGITESAFSNWRKKPTSRMDLSNVCKIANFLGVTIDYLLTGKEEIANPADLSEDKLRLLNYYDLMTEREQGEFISDAKNLTKGRDEEFIQDVG